MVLDLIYGLWPHLGFMHSLFR